MHGALLPLWIIGGPFLGMLFLSGIYRGGSSASTAVTRRPSGPNDGRWTPERTSADYRPTAHPAAGTADDSATLEQISRLSGPVDPGAISELSGHRSPGAISSLSAWKSPGAISRLSRNKSPGAISRLSGPRSPGAIAELSKSRPVGSIGRLSGGFYVSHLFGLPLLTRSQSPIEPDDTLLIDERHSKR